MYPKYVQYITQCQHRGPERECVMENEMKKKRKERNEMCARYMYM